VSLLDRFVVVDDDDVDIVDIVDIVVVGCWLLVVARQNQCSAATYYIASVEQLSPLRRLPS